MRLGTFSISITPARKIIPAPTLVEFTVAEVIIPQQNQVEKIHTLLIDCFSSRFLTIRWIESKGQKGKLYRLGHYVGGKLTQVG